MNQAPTPPTLPPQSFKLEATHNTLAMSATSSKTVCNAISTKPCGFHSNLALCNPKCKTLTSQILIEKKKSLAHKNSGISGSKKEVSEVRELHSFHALWIGEEGARERECVM